MKNGQGLEKEHDPGKVTFELEKLNCLKIENL